VDQASYKKNIIFWALNEWQKQNEHLHHEKDRREMENRRNRCQEEMIELYERQENRLNKK
jgi:hypothetical protein